MKHKIVLHTVDVSILLFLKIYHFTFLYVSLTCFETSIIADFRYNIISYFLYSGVFFFFFKFFRDIAVFIISILLV